MSTSLVRVALNGSDEKYCDAYMGCRLEVHDDNCIKSIMSMRGIATRQRCAKDRGGDSMD